ncbi:hypothetical protein T484DRAFT_3238717 [Baffinella frigidus]|nr:hypothetical protein T484DRAFT_3238717 [Cryptophyta sp. CCMP2293]
MSRFGRCAMGTPSRPAGPSGTLAQHVETPRLPHTPATRQPHLRDPSWFRVERSEEAAPPRHVSARHLTSV